MNYVSRILMIAVAAGALAGCGRAAISPPTPSPSPITYVSITQRKVYCPNLIGKYRNLEDIIKGRIEKSFRKNKGLREDMLPFPDGFLLELHSDGSFTYKLSFKRPIESEKADAHQKSIEEGICEPPKSNA